MVQKARKQKRRRLIYYLRVVNPSTNDLLGRLVDISPIGFMLIAEKPFVVGEDLPARILFPDEEGEILPIDVTAQAVWCHKDVNPDYYAAGFQFIQPSQESIFAIKDIIDALAFHG